MEMNKLWKYIYNKANTNKVKEARMRIPGRKDNMNPGIIVQEASAFLQDQGFSKTDYGANPKPRTFNIFDKQGETHVIVAINGDYTDDIIINAFFDSCCGYGYVIQAQTLDGRIEWAGFDKAEFLEDLEDALVSATEFFEANKDKHTLETWLSQEFEEDEVRDIIEKYHFNGHEDAFMKLLSRDEFEAELAGLNKGNFKESKSLRENTADYMEMLEEIKAELENVPEITNVEILYDINGDEYLKVEGPYDGCPGSNHPVTKLIKSIAEKYGKETEGWGWLYQTERARDWEKENPAPVDPRYARGTSKLFTPSARSPKNKEARELLANYKKELEEWRTYKKENCPPSRDPGFTVSFAPAGHAASVAAFYNNTKYWGD